MKYDGWIILGLSLALVLNFYNGLTLISGESSLYVAAIDGIVLAWFFGVKLGEVPND